MQQTINDLEDELQKKTEEIDRFKFISSCDHRINKQQLENLDEKLELALKGWEDAIIFSERLRTNLLDGAISTKELPFCFTNIASDRERQYISNNWLQKNKAMREALKSFENPPTKKQKKDDAK